MGLSLSVETSSAVRRGDSQVVEHSTWSHGPHQTASASSRMLRRGEHVEVQQQAWASGGGQAARSASFAAFRGPGGVAQVQSQVCDGSGHERVVLERRVGDQARRVEKTVDRNTGEEETRDHTKGIPEGHEASFDLIFERHLRAWGQGLSSIIVRRPDG